MRVLRVRFQDKVFYGALQEVPKESPEEGGASFDLFVQCLNKELGFTEPIPLQMCGVLPPVVPTKMICVAVNYRQHAEEMGHTVPEEPVLFLKPPSAVIGSGQPVILPSVSQRVDYEGELAVIIGKNCRNVPPDQVAEHIFGYACANDVTARDIQKRDGQYGRAKGFDTFAPIGPWIETQVEDPSNLELITSLNGEEKQRGNTSDMVFSPYELVSNISKSMTLFPGDVILTGTPSGVGALKSGDEVRVEISQVGTLITPVVSEAELKEIEAEKTQQKADQDSLLQ